LVDMLWSRSSVTLEDWLHRALREHDVNEGQKKCYHDAFTDSTKACT